MEGAVIEAVRLPGVVCDQFVEVPAIAAIGDHAAMPVDAAGEGIGMAEAALGPSVPLRSVGVAKDLGHGGLRTGIGKRLLCPPCMKTVRQAEENAGLKRNPV